VTTVVAAVIKRQGRILICRRRADDSHAFKWEFPGGKLEAGESPEQALARELREELDIRAEVGRQIECYDYCYPGRAPLFLIFYSVTEFNGEPRNCVFEEIAWTEPRRLPEFDFLEGDTEFVKRLAAAE
jgi:8-oxo-dGTP diphosphatase